MLGVAGIRARMRVAWILLPVVSLLHHRLHTGMPPASVWGWGLEVPGGDTFEGLTLSLIAFHLGPSAG